MASIMSQVQSLDATVTDMLGQNVRNIMVNALTGAGIGWFAMRFAKSLAIIVGLSVISFQLLNEYEILTIDWSHIIDEARVPIRKLLESCSLYNIWRENGFVGGLLIGISLV